MKTIKGIYNLITPYGDIDVQVIYFNPADGPEIVEIKALFREDDEDDHKCNVREWIANPSCSSEINEQLTYQILDEYSEEEFDPNAILDK